VDHPLFQRVDSLGGDAEGLLQALDLDRGGGGEGIGRQNEGTLPLGVASDRRQRGSGS
jgi:hypothetical protein